MRPPKQHRGAPQPFVHLALALPSLLAPRLRILQDAQGLPLLAVAPPEDVLPSLDARARGGAVRGGEIRQAQHCVLRLLQEPAWITAHATQGAELLVGVNVQLGRPPPKADERPPEPGANLDPDLRGEVVLARRPQSHEWIRPGDLLGDAGGLQGGHGLVPAQGT